MCARSQTSGDISGECWAISSSSSTQSVSAMVRRRALQGGERPRGRWLGGVGTAAAAGVARQAGLKWRAAVGRTFLFGMVASARVCHDVPSGEVRRGSARPTGRVRDIGRARSSARRIRGRPPQRRRGVRTRQRGLRCGEAGADRLAELRVGGADPGGAPPDERRAGAVALRAERFRGRLCGVGGDRVVQQGGRQRGRRPPSRRRPGRRSSAAPASRAGGPAGRAC